MIRPNAIQRSILVEGPEDAVGLWQVARETRAALGLHEADAVRRAAIDSIRPLLEDGYVHAGNLGSDGGFTAWRRQGRDAVARIDAAWLQLARDPNIGEIGWLFNTALGNSLARSLRE